MADSIVQDVVNQSRSVGDLSPSDAAATTIITDSKPAEDVNGVVEVATKENGLHTPAILADLDDASARSDTDTSRAEGSVAGDKPTESKPLKKFAPAKPMSFTKYTAPKVVAANAATKTTDKAPTPTSTTPSLQALGRPRLVAKTTGSLQQKAKAYKEVAPDPMQVWNKNRITPAPSTKHLTDEELKQQYGIHLTSRLQADAEGKEAKWADIDDDEDDWAPETIEWNDGTKTTLAASEMPPANAAPNKADMPQSTDSAQLQPARPVPPQFVSSVGPNATVLKLGANVEKQMAQRAAAEKSRSPLEKTSRHSPSNTTPAPVPSKSPWASLPPVEKVSPVEIAPQPMMPPPNRYGQGYGPPPTAGAMQAPSPAREMSADDFNRAWREGQSNQPRELFMPNSGRYEAVPEGRRRMSRNDQGFRAPAVLQRPSGSDPHGPAEPSAAFQTTRTSSDVNRRRTSSIVSGGSGQIARRLSLKSGDFAHPVFDNPSPDVSVRPTSRDGPPSQTQTPAYQARQQATDYVAVGTSGLDLEAEREKQKLMMKESGIRARQRRLEEEAKLEAEKQERIKKKLAALEAAHPQPEKKSEPSNERPSELESSKPGFLRDSTTEAPRMADSASHSPPKPPQPLATGEPQQYGMIKVHPLDTAKKMGMAEHQRPFASMRPDRESFDESSRTFQPGPNGIRPSESQRPFGSDSVAAPEPSPKLPKPVSASNGAVGRGWGEARDHRGPAGGNLWGISSNKALGNGTFDQTLAGYAPQDLSRTPSGAPGWSNGRTPNAGRSPHITEARMPPGSPLASPDQGPLAVDSEADTLFPAVRPAPIGPPQQQGVPPSSNGMTNSPLLGNNNTGNNLAAWNNFHSVAGAQERAENDRLQRELAASKEEEQRTGVRRGPQYTFNETWKQVQVGEHPTQRETSGMTHSSVPASSFGAVGSLTSAPATRGSRFFPSPVTQPADGRRAATHGYPEPPHSPSPPPAEEYASAHPAFDGDLNRPAVRFPREKAVVKLPPMRLPTPPAEPSEEKPSGANQPLTWAARAAMAPSAHLRNTSTPIAQTSSWQERFNGLFDKKPASQKHPGGFAEPSPAVETSTRELLDVLGPHGASVSMPDHGSATQEDGSFTAVSKEVEDEEDLFEDRELASLPIISLPLQAFTSLPLAPTPRYHFTKGLETTSGDFNWMNFGRGAQYANVRAPGMMRTIRVDLPAKQGAPPSHHKSTSTKPPSKRGGFNRGGRSRGASKAS